MVAEIGYVRPFILLSIYPSIQAFFWNCMISFGMVLKTYMKLCMTDPDFLKKNFCPQKWENRPRMGQKHDFLSLLKNVYKYLFFYNKHLIRSCTNPIF